MGTETSTNTNNDTQNDSNNQNVVKSRGTNKIQLAASVLGGSAMMAAYHTSVLVNGTEYFFDASGIMKTSNCGSHQNKQQMQIIDIGFSNKNGSDLEYKLRQYFKTGTYDLLRKNCNSFSDCALWYLTKQRLPSTYNRLEKIGAQFMPSMAGNEYQPNPKADGFNIEEVIAVLEDKLIFKQSQGLSLGGGINAQSKDEMRQKRLAMLQKKMGK